MKYVAVLLGKYLSEAFHINNDLKQEDAFFFCIVFQLCCTTKLGSFRQMKRS